MKTIIEIEFTPDLQRHDVNDIGARIMSEILEENLYVTEVKYKVIKDDE